MSVPPTGQALIAVSRFNEAVTRKLLDGARTALADGGYDVPHVSVVWVPGAFELPLVVHAAVTTGDFELAVALGAVIRGETPHFDYVSAAASQGLMEVAVRTGVPVGFGLLTCDSLSQAMDRAGGAAGNKGEEAARAAIDTLAALRSLRGRAAT